jgi:spore coat polysaccharide biosynthesis predicted glycosyltransferase SpsG
MAGLMQWADVAVSAAGSTCWELAYMGIPPAVVVLADNQEIIADGLEKMNAAVNLGRIEALTAAKFRNGFLPIIESNAKRMELVRNQQKLIDGLGADRVISRMNK